MHQTENFRDFLPQAEGGLGKPVENSWDVLELLRPPPSEESSSRQLIYSRGLYFVSIAASGNSGCAGKFSVPVPFSYANQLIHSFLVDKAAGKGYAYVINDRGRDALAFHFERLRIMASQRGVLEGAVP